MTGKLGKWWRLSGSGKLMLAEAWVLLGIARACVLACSFTRVLRWFRGRPGGSAADVPAAVPGSVAPRVSRAIAVAARHTPWDSNCLAQALAAGFMLRMRGVPSDLFLGVARPGASVEAHAWLRSGSVIVCGGAGHERFSVVSRF